MGTTCAAVKSLCAALLRPPAPSHFSDGYRGLQLFWGTYVTRKLLVSHLLIGDSDDCERGAGRHRQGLLEPVSASWEWEWLYSIHTLAALLFGDGAKVAPALLHIIRHCKKWLIRHGPRPTGRILQRHDLAGLDRDCPLVGADQVRILGRASRCRCGGMGCRMGNLGNSKGRSVSLERDGRLHFPARLDPCRQILFVTAKACCNPKYFSLLEIYRASWPIVVSAHLAA